MGKMYGVVMNNTIVGIHEDINVCNNYLQDVRINKNSLCSVVKLKKKYKKNEKIYELYLLKYGDSYIQSKYYDTIEHEDSVILDEYKEARSTLLNLLNFKVFGKYKTLIPAFDKMALKMFGGTMDIEEYRNHLSNDEKTYSIEFPPCNTIIPMLEEIYKKNNLSNTFIPLDKQITNMNIVNDLKLK